MGTNYVRKRFTTFDGSESVLRCTYFRTSDVFQIQVDDEERFTMDASALDALRDCIEALRLEVAAVDHYQPSVDGVEFGPDDRR